MQLDLQAPPSEGFTAVFGPLDLAGAEVLAKGADRYVFQHPHEPSLLIKVINMEAYAAYLERKPLKRFYKQFQRESAYRVYLNELSEYVTTTTVPSGVWNIPMARVVGLAQTTLGLGQLVEKITGEDGQLAPTVAHIMARDGISAALGAQLDAFFEDLIDTHIVINDMSARNIALGRNAEGRYGMYLIDGFGVLPLVPLYAWSKRLNKRRMQHKYKAWRARMLRQFGPGRAAGQATIAP
ncbi:PhoP regulatory network YrbL family protein [Bordetella petrii]|uniref:PhoP regulatory network YrbL family protein n=1 Tax=Bordetella petrii TaxID=94624 RepID=UPI001E4B022E|nr:PhoP regulatory network YrbL family protein [Bordetella petrii]MCD0504853.1 PhoP regulatory network YrbL family protein [Bordetella petrii]